MAYKPENLSVLSYANGFTLWHYRTEDAATAVDTSGYFDVAAKMLRVGDFIMLNAGLGTTPTHGMMVVAGNADGHVDLSNMVQFGVLNSD
ncbi:MAG TPA: hypothetical protein VHL31_01415 [Geminicoccus sp.]|jgi:hypothetical protein|uniref:hypothetical protein n=1 Tax=Geminicoccus sp. TaxID=2024832 RepID=UPI002E3802AD|nr:hypothetical protein [Geminicoccus sp.]HEX2524944.1 hypothetical protein [Geminicoccus sp.]